MPRKVPIGSAEDCLHIRLGELNFVLTEHYEVKISFFQQPAAFTLRLGPKLISGENPNARRERLIADVLAAARPGTEFELSVQRPDGNRVVVQSGRLDARGSPSAEHLQVELKGRDWMAPLFDSYIEEEVSFTEKTYYDLTRKILDLVGLKETKDAAGNTRFGLITTPDNAKRINASRRQRSKGNTELIRQTETGATSGTGTLVLKTLKAKLGTRYYDFLQDAYKLAALSLYATGEGNFVLTRPNIDQDPAFLFVRSVQPVQDGVRVEDSNILSHAYQDDTTQRHSAIVVYGRSGGGKAGRNGYRGEVTDHEMVDYGFNKKQTVHDEDVKSNAECEYVARKMIAEERRNGWRLSYTVAGHTMPSLQNAAGRAIFGPDMIGRAEDDQLDIHANLWLDNITFSRGPDAKTTVDLCWPNDLQLEPPPTPAVPKPSKKVFPKDPAKQPDPPKPSTVQAATGNTGNAPNQQGALLEGGSGGTGSAGPGYGARSPKNTSGGEGGASGLGPTRGAETTTHVPQGPDFGSRSPSSGAGGTSGRNSGGGGGAGGF
jgi:prophage tail gpP-like protein